MTRTHVVVVGDWLGSIAARYGIRPALALWEHPANAALRVKRGTADLLMVGDELVIPAELQRRGVRVPTGSRVVFRVARADVLRFRLADVALLIEGLGPLPYEVELGDQTFTGELTEADPEIQIPLRVTATKARLRVLGRDLGEFSIGGLGPVTEERGAHARLVNLGYAAPALGAPVPGTSAFATALRVFQRSARVPETGELDEATQAALQEVYGS